MRLCVRLRPFGLLGFGRLGPLALPVLPLAALLGLRSALRLGCAPLEVRAARVWSWAIAVFS